MAWAFAQVGVAIASAAQQIYPQLPGDPDHGFVAIFDGHSFAGWEGDPDYWRVAHGAIVGEVRLDNLLRQNSFLIWRGGQPWDFELKLSYRITARGNSGVNYRSVQVEDGPFALRGYQSDIDGPNPDRPGTRHTANNYEERGRTFLALRGQITRADANGERLIVGRMGDYQELTRVIRDDADAWNDLQLIVRGNVMTHLLNDQVMSVVIDDDPVRRRAEGLIGVQVNVGPPMKVEFRDIRLRDLSISAEP